MYNLYKYVMRRLDDSPNILSQVARLLILCYKITTKQSRKLHEKPVYFFSN